MIILSAKAIETVTVALNITHYTLLITHYALRNTQYAIRNTQYAYVAESMTNAKSLTPPRSLQGEPYAGIAVIIGFRVWWLQRGKVCAPREARARLMIGNW